MILQHSNVMVGAVPIYRVAAELAANNKSILHMSHSQLFEAIEKQCQDGIDYMTVHCGVTQKSMELASMAKKGYGYCKPWGFTAFSMDEAS
jgi:phosphomethylpyrimidine synthase